MDEIEQPRNSILDDLGQEVTGIAAPVSLCMLLTVLLVRILNPKGANQQLIAIATAYYHEKVDAPFPCISTKILGTLLMQLPALAAHVKQAFVLLFHLYDSTATVVCVCRELMMTALSSSDLSLTLSSLSLWLH